MHGKTPVKFRLRCRKGFSFIEILIVITIMAIVIGVVGSLMAGYIRMFNETDDQSVAKRRATDVFNALQVPIINAGLGIPVTEMGWYFSWPSGYGSSVAVSTPVANWAAPIDIRNTSSYSVSQNQGNVMRVVYSIPTGWKNGTKLVELEPNDGTIIPKPTAPPYAANIRLAGEYITFASNAAPASATEITTGRVNDIRSFITVPNAYARPMYVSTYDSGEKKASIFSRPRFYETSTTIPISVGDVAPFSELHAVRAIVAYVDGKSVFHAAEVNDSDVSVNPPISSDLIANAAGLRVEGIKAIRFEADADHKTLTVRVLAEGEIIDQTRKDDTKTRQTLRSRWLSVTNWDERIYYEDYSMTWRTRNYAPE